MSEETTVTEQLYLVSLELKAAKLQEAIATKRRIEFEEKIISLIPPELEVHKGQTTISLRDGSKITTKAGVNVKADIEGIREIFNDHEIDTSPPINSKTTYALDLKGYKWYEENHPDIYNQIAEHVTVTPKKIGVELKPVKKEK